MRALLAAIACWLPLAAAAANYQGVVSHVTDGDTVWVRPSDGRPAQQIRIVISDCLPGRVNLSPVLGPLGFRRRVYGCAQIYQRRR